MLALGLQPCGLQLLLGAWQVDQQRLLHRVGLRALGSPFDVQAARDVLVLLDLRLPLLQARDREGQPRPALLRGLGVEGLFEILIGRLERLVDHPLRGLRGADALLAVLVHAPFDEVGREAVRPHDPVHRLLAGEQHPLRVQPRRAAELGGEALGLVADRPDLLGVGRHPRERGVEGPGLAHARLDLEAEVRATVGERAVGVLILEAVGLERREAALARHVLDRLQLSQRHSVRGAKGSHAGHGGSCVPAAAGRGGGGFAHGLVGLVARAGRLDRDLGAQTLQRVVIEVLQRVDLLGQAHALGGGPLDRRLRLGPRGRRAQLDAHLGRRSARQQRAHRPVAGPPLQREHTAGGQRARRERLGRGSHAHGGAVFTVLGGAAVRP